MNRPFSILPGGADASALAYWRPGEAGGSLANLVPGGPTLTAYAAPTPLQDGYQFVATSAQYLQATLADQAELPAWTIEAWGRAWAVPDGETGAIVEWRKDANNRVRLIAVAGAGSYLSGVLRAVDTTWSLVWSDAAVDTLLKAAAPWHVALVANAGTGVAGLYVNGALRASAAPNRNLAAGDYTVYVGRSIQDAKYASAVLDEPRISSVARYTAAFAITRYAEGRRVLARGPGDGVMTGGVAA